MEADELARFAMFKQPADVDRGQHPTCFVGIFFDRAGILGGVEVLRREDERAWVGDPFLARHGVISIGGKMLYGRGLLQSPRPFF